MRCQNVRRRIRGRQYTLSEGTIRPKRIAVRQEAREYSFLKIRFGTIQSRFTRSFCSSFNIGSYPFDKGDIPVKFSVLVERDEDGYYIASVPELPGCHTQAKTLDELTNRVKEAIELYLEAEGAKTEEKIELIGVQFIEVPTK